MRAEDLTLHRVRWKEGGSSGTVEVVRGEERDRLLKSYPLCCNLSNQYLGRRFTLDLRGTPFKVASWKHRNNLSSTEDEEAKLVCVACLI
jgi:hypothetical protein